MSLKKDVRADAFALKHQNEVVYQIGFSVVFAILWENKTTEKIAKVF